MSYRVELSANNRAVCQATECKKEGVKITKGELRFGTFVTIQENQSWKWKHWGCVTPVVLKNVLESTENDMSLMDGYEDLDEESQDKVKRGIEQGHVDDEDWKGDVEYNRPGMKGYRAKVKTPKKVKSDGDDSTPSLTKKRSHPDEDDVDGANSEKPKKPKKAKKSNKTKKPDNVDAEDSEVSAINGDTKADVDSDEELVPKSSKKRGRPKKQVEKEEDGDDEAAAVVKAAKGRGRPKKAVKADEQDESGDESAKPVRGRGRPKKSTTTTKVGRDQDVQEPAKRRGRPKKSSKVMDEDANSDGEELNGDADEDDEPEKKPAKKGRGRPKKQA